MHPAGDAVTARQLLGLAPRRTLVALLAAAGTVAGIHFAALAPLARHSAALDARARRLAADVAQVTLAAQELTQWLGQGAAAGQEDPRIADSMTPDLAVPALLQQLSELGARHSVELLSIRPGPPEAPVTVETGDGAPRTYVRIPVHLTARAQYRQLGALLEDLQRQGSLSLVRDVHLTADSRRGLLTVDLWVDAFGRLP
ncbi:MAG TPA: GspMb/PilO family protein [Candidatus Saccharimonadales bacterium]|nr:GspMb/PilO family protein [Candidatus Saccharimonadales bacterium]